MNSNQGSGKRQLQERNFEIVVNHITINEDQLPRVSRQSVEALKHVFGHNIKKYSGTFHHKPGNDHVHFLVMSEAPKTKSAVKARIAASLALIFGAETGFVEVKMFNELKADAEPAHGLKGLGDYRSLYVNNNDHANHRPKDPEHRTVEFMCGGEWDISHGGARKAEAYVEALGDGEQLDMAAYSKALKAKGPSQSSKKRKLELEDEMPPVDEADLALPTARDSWDSGIARYFSLTAKYHAQQLRLNKHMALWLAGGQPSQSQEEED